MKSLEIPNPRQILLKYLLKFTDLMADDEITRIKGEPSLVKFFFNFFHFGKILFK